MDWALSPCSQTAQLTTYQALSAEDTWIAHFGPAKVKTQSCHRPTLYMLCTAFADRSEVWIDKDI